ncbi:putative serine/threonine-specific protein kinase [Mycoplasma sp. CAG:472]|nr:putative serine/threonine-specific protein kinase [Mycoplasma sp. CAG:472]
MIAKGQKISDRYQIIKSIGEGGMANVYLAYDTILERNVAVKVLRGDLANDEKFVRRFQREALQASSLSHPNIVEVYDVGEDNGEYYIVMEYVEGKHLKGLLKKRGKLTIPEVVDIMIQVTSGLTVAHDSYIIHRDIKPQNIMILDNGLVKLTDFGIALAMNSTQLTQTNSVMGSVHYLPPEGASGKGATLQSDIYSLGILMYELLTGKLPFRGETAVEIALKQLKEPMPSIRKEIPDIPQSIENIILRATAKNPKNRYADAREMHDDLLTCLDESRKNEIKISLKYPEIDLDDGKMLKLKNENLTKKESDEIIAKRITQKDINKNQNKSIVILLSIFTGIVVLITSIVVLLPKLTKKAQVTVPDVSNMTVVKAIETLQEEGFTVSQKQIEKSSTVIDEGKIISTSPSGGTKHKKGYEITLYVSTGSKSVEVEDYTGKNYLEVKGKLEAYGINVIIEKKEMEVDTDEDYETNIIMDQSIKKGEHLSKGDNITLYIPDIKNLYPDFTDGTYSVSDIIDFANEYKLKLKFIDKDSKTISITSENANEYADYKILNQNRTAGTKVTENASFTIKIDVSSSSEGGSDNKTCKEEGLC